MDTYFENYYGYLASHWQMGFVFWVVILTIGAAVYITSKVRAARRRARFAQMHADLKAARAARHNY